MPKDAIFSKMKKRDYNRELETVLDKKQFPEDVKNLLLSMLYKIEIAYDDYSKIKVDVLNKNDYIEKIIQIILEECENIKLIKTGSKQYEEFIKNNIKYQIDKKNKEIQVYQDEKNILQAIFELSESTNFVNIKYGILKEAMETFLKEASIIDEGEIIRDFNGWSWSTIEDEIRNLQYNLIYQNLLILVGRQFIKEWTNASTYIVDYMEELANKMKSIYGEKLANKYIQLLYKILIQKYVIEKNKKRRVDSRIKELKSNLEEYKDSIKFLEKLSKEKKEILKEIEKIDMIIFSRESLEKEYKKQYKEEEITIKTYKDRLKKDREKKIKRTREISLLMEPKSFTRRKRKEEKELGSLENLEFHNETIEKEIIDLQNVFIECIKYKLKNIIRKMR